MNITRSTTPQNVRNSRNLAHIRQAQINGSNNARSSNDVLASLRATQIVASKPVLPAELIATILDYLPVPDLMCFARVSRRLQEMVYDDSRWIQKLKAIGVWNEGEARHRVEEAIRKKAEGQKVREEAARKGGGGGGGDARGHAGSVTLFDAGVEERRSLERQQHKVPPIHMPERRRRQTLADGFDGLTMSPASPQQPNGKAWDSSLALTVLSRVRSVRGLARQEFGKVFGALGPLYNDLARSKGHSDAIVFRTYRDPEQQAQILFSLKRFCKCDNAFGWQEREEKLDSLIGVFENAVLREFQQGYAANDIEGRMHRYAHVLVALNGGNAAIDTFISSHPIMTRTQRVGNPLDCLDSVASGHVDLNLSRVVFEKLARILVEQAEIIDKVFPPSVDVLTPFLSRLCDDILSDYTTALFDEAHNVGIETYVKAVAGTFEQSLRFIASLKPTKASPPGFAEKAKQMVTQCYEKHIDLYLAEEYSVFKTKSEAAVSHWEKVLSDQETSTESFFMSNINRQAAKRDFMSSFRKVVMMPVNVVSAPFAPAKPIINKNLTAADPGIRRSRSPTLTGPDTPQRPGTPQAEPPSTELAAKAAIMNSRLEGIKSLFSIEVALNLTHLAKASIERAAVISRIGGKQGQDAKEQCEFMFVTLLSTLGDRHIKNGFDKAIKHLGTYNPREVRELRGHAPSTAQQASAVEPLVTFLELVNVGDLIQQMIDVFYAQELVATKLTDRDDFLAVAGKEKKRFEQMLDERVAAGLNKGIDVLMDEVEYICATTQTTADFNPGGIGSTDTNGHNTGVLDIGPSATAIQVVDLIGSHTGMLTGTTDKNMLDVFTQEVGLRLFTVLTKHFKRQRISVDGAIKLISDINHYSAFTASLRQKPLVPYFQALREMSQIYLVQIDPPGNLFGGGGQGKGGKAKASRGSVMFGGKASATATQAKELAAIIADSARYCGIFPTEEVYEFAERRADWYLVRGDVERAMYGVGCVVM